MPLLDDTNQVTPWFHRDFRFWSYTGANATSHAANANPSGTEFRLLWLNVGPSCKSRHQRQCLIFIHGYQCLFLHQLGPFELSAGGFPPISSDTTEDALNYVSNERQPPAMIYRAPERQGPGHRRSRRPCRINIKGLWIDKEDLRHGARQGSGTISVHKCRWDASNGPCGMWIMGSRSHVGAHIRTWHSRRRQVNSTAECLWEGCTQTMPLEGLDQSPRRDYPSR